MRALRPLLLTRAFLHRAPLLEGRAVRPLNRERASRIGEGVDHEAERQRLHEERVEERKEYLTGPRQLRGPGVLAIPEAQASARLAPYSPGTGGKACLPRSYAGGMSGRKPWPLANCCMYL